MKNLEGILNLLKSNEEFIDDMRYGLCNRKHEIEGVDILDMVYESGYGTHKSIYKEMTNLGSHEVSAHEIMQVLNLFVAYFITKHLDEDTTSKFKIVDGVITTGSSDSIELFVGMPIEGLDYLPKFFSIEIDLRTNDINLIIDKYVSSSYLEAEIIKDESQMIDKIKASHGIVVAKEDDNVTISDSTIEESVQVYQSLKRYIDTITDGSGDVYKITKGDYKYAGKKLYSMYSGDTKLEDMSIAQIQEFIDDNRMYKAIVENELKKDGDYEYVRDQCMFNMLVKVNEQPHLNDLIDIMYPNEE